MDARGAGRAGLRAGFFAGRRVVFLGGGFLLAMAAFSWFDAGSGVPFRFSPSSLLHDYSRPVSRLAAPLAAAALLLAAAPVAHAATSRDISAFADRVSAVWAKRQDSRGYFLDPRTGRHQG
ncbi:MAG: hypothetical protein QOF37_2436, partial [Thermoleophilaceae bacterium]|nr:hypothetical protein [Thermoleophilaceae bacterium]